jgi:hypothetical protein
MSRESDLFESGLSVILPWYIEVLKGRFPRRPLFTARADMKDVHGISISYDNCDRLVQISARETAAKKDLFTSISGKNKCATMEMGFDGTTELRLTEEFTEDSLAVQLASCANTSVSFEVVIHWSATSDNHTSHLVTGSICGKKFDGPMEIAGNRVPETFLKTVQQAQDIRIDNIPIGCFDPRLMSVLSLLAWQSMSEGDNMRMSEKDQRFACAIAVALGSMIGAGPLVALANAGAMYI